MNKTELVAAMADKAGISKKDAEASLKAFTEVVAEEAYFADSKREGDAGAAFENAFGATAPGSMGADFEVSSSADDLPF